VGGKGEGVAASAALKICLIKTQVTHKLSSKTHVNVDVYVKHVDVKPLKQKSLLRY
jgi:hypothetical protein